jgi:hypothetical protein
MKGIIPKTKGMISNLKGIVSNLSASYETEPSVLSRVSATEEPFREADAPRKTFLPGKTIFPPSTISTNTQST